MSFAILTAFLSLFVLVILHELGHFVFARKFGVLVEEFGVGLPPRLFGKKIGDTVYSVNLLPLGAFVRLLGEEQQVGGPHSFSSKSILQRAIIVIGGVAVFWIVAAVLFSFLMVLGAPSVVDDEDTLTKNSQVQVIGVAPGSPAEIAGLNAGDIIKQFSIAGGASDTSSAPAAINRVSQVQGVTEQYKGQELVLTVQRGKEVFDVAIVPRLESPKGEGPLGVALVRTALVAYPWWQAPWRGIAATVDITFGVIGGWITIADNLLEEGSVPPGTQFAGPVGIFSLFAQASAMGVNYYLQFIALISVYLALFNVLPIPAVDGGKLMFLLIEAVRKKPLPHLVEQRITAAFFLALISLLIFVTIKDIARLS